MSEKQLCQMQLKTPIDHKSDLHLNQATINKYMSLIMKRSPDTVYAFNSLFYQLLPKTGYSTFISLLTVKQDIFSKKKIFVPISFPAMNHWCLIHIDFDKKTIEYYDSLGRRNFDCLKLILKYILFEHLYKKGKQLNADGWVLMNMMECPKQENNYDSGLFVCMFAEHLSRGAPLEFTQKDMNSFRKQLNSEIKMNKLIHNI